jgi:phage terminase large subunit GpA-like protein
MFNNDKYYGDFQYETSAQEDARKWLDIEGIKLAIEARHNIKGVSIRGVMPKEDILGLGKQELWEEVTIGEYHEENHHNFDKYKYQFVCPNCGRVDRISWTATQLAKNTADEVMVGLTYKCPCSASSVRTKLSVKDWESKVQYIYDEDGNFSHYEEIVE